MRDPSPSPKTGREISPYKPICDPCPCTTLETGASIIAGFKLFCNAIACLIVFGKGMQYSDEITQKSGTELAAVVILPVIVIGDIILAIFLTIGLCLMSRWRCCVYVIGSSITLLLSVTLLILYFDIGHASEKSVNVGVVGLYFVYLSFSAYGIIIVYCFAQELKPRKDPCCSFFCPQNFKAQMGCTLSSVIVNVHNTTEVRVEPK